MDQMIESVRGDLEDLLNSRCMTLIPADKFPEVRDSIVTFGVPDLPALESPESELRDRVARVIEDVVVRFEPRLTNVKAIPVAKSDKSDKLSFDYEIQAILRLDSSPEVKFMTVLNLSTGSTTVQQGILQ